GGGGRIVCHINHVILRPSSAMQTGPNAVFSTCHESGSSGSKTAAHMAQLNDGLDAELKRSENTLMLADKYGMEVSEAQVKLGDGRENLVKARLAMHSFQIEGMRKPIEAGMGIAAETLRAGQTALHDKNVRRIGLAVSVFWI